MGELVRLETGGDAPAGVATIRLERPPMNALNTQVQEEMGRNQREYVLRQQLKAIKEELGEDDGDQGDLDGFEDRIAKANLPR